MECVPDVNERIYDETERVPDVNEGAPDATEHVPDVKERIPDVKEHVPDVTERIPDVTEHVPDVTERIPDVTERVIEGRKRRFLEKTRLFDQKTGKTGGSPQKRSKSDRCPSQIGSWRWEIENDARRVCQRR